MTRAHDRDTSGFSLVELCVVMVVMGILFVMASAMFQRARMSGNEAAAVGAMRSINSAQFAYLNGCGRGYYATSFTVLGAKPTADAQAYISDDLGASAAPERNGYRFTMSLGADGAATGIDCMGRPTQTAYYAAGVPVAFGNTGSLSFATNQNGAVWEVSGSSPPTEPFGPPADVVD